MENQVTQKKIEHLDNEIERCKRKIFDLSTQRSQLQSVEIVAKNKALAGQYFKRFNDNGDHWYTYEKVLFVTETRADVLEIELTIAYFGDQKRSPSIKVVSYDLGATTSRNAVNLRAKLDEDSNEVEFLAEYAKIQARLTELVINSGGK